MIYCRIVFKVSDFECVCFFVYVFNFVVIRKELWVYLNNNNVNFLWFFFGDFNVVLLISERSSYIVFIF